MFRHAAYPPSWRPAVLAAVLAAGQGAVASHMSAPALWAYEDLVERPPYGAIRRWPEVSA